MKVNLNLFIYNIYIFTFRNSSRYISLTLMTLATATATAHLLLEKILSYKDRSPLISILDDCSQSARPLLKEFVRHANKGCVHFIISPINC